MDATLWPYGKCVSCANENYCVRSENEILNCMTKGYRNFRAMTHADRIRSFTDEELADWVWGAETAGRAYGPRGKKAWLDWLRQEADDDTN